MYQINIFHPRFCLYRNNFYQLTEEPKRSLILCCAMLWVFFFSHRHHRHNERTILRFSCYWEIMFELIILLFGMRSLPPELILSLRVSHPENCFPISALAILWLWMPWVRVCDMNLMCVFNMPCEFTKIVFTFLEFLTIDSRENFVRRRKFHGAMERLDIIR